MAPAARHDARCITVTRPLTPLPERWDVMPLVTANRVWHWLALSPPQTTDCGVCSQGYGRGLSNSCHKCTAEFQGVMFFASAVAVVISVIVVILLGVYLVSAIFGLTFSLCLSLGVWS